MHWLLNGLFYFSLFIMIGVIIGIIAIVDELCLTNVDQEYCFQQ
jgi:hypothetical protein